MEITIVVAIAIVAFVCVFCHWQSLTKFTRVRAEGFYSHYQNLSSELNKFPLDPTTDYLQVVENTIEEVAEVNRLLFDAYDTHAYAFEVVQLASVVATNRGRFMSFRDVVLAAVLLDLKAKNRKTPSRYSSFHAEQTVDLIIPPNF